MKFNIKQLFAPLALTTLLFTACDKAETVDPIGDGGQKIIKWVDYGGLQAGFTNSNLSFDPTSPEESLEVHLQYSGGVLLKEDVTVTLEVSQAKLDAYNAMYTDPTKQYSLLPADAYELPTTTVKIHAGEVISEGFEVIFHPDMIDGSRNFMLPVTIKSISGGPADLAAASGTGTAYFHFIGNPLAGLYRDLGVRWNLTGAVTWPGPPAGLGLATAMNVPSVNPPTAAAPAFTYDYDSPFGAIDAFTVYGQFGNIPTPGGSSATFYIITASTDYSSITYDFEAVLTAGYSNIDKYIRGYVAPAAGVKPAFRLVTKYNNTTGGAGNDRLVDETFRHL